MKNKKSLAAIIAIALIIGIGGTFAYFTFTESFNNNFTLGSENIDFEEVFDSPDDWLPCTITPKVLDVKNKSSFGIDARISFQEYWEELDENGRATGERLPNQVNGEDAAIKNINTADWTYNATDGYYYYKETIAGGASSSNFIDKVTFNCNATSVYSNAKYHLVIKVQTKASNGQWGN